MGTFKNLLVTTDFSEASRGAFDEARALAAALGAHLHLLNVAEPLHEPWAGYTPGAKFTEMTDRLQVEAHDRLECLVPQDELASGRVVIATAWGEPAAEILKYARDHDIDLIVCGTHGRRGLDHFMMGSVAERIVRLAPCPVLTVHASRDQSRAAA